MKVGNDFGYCSRVFFFLFKQLFLYNLVFPKILTDWTQTVMNNHKSDT